MIKVLIDSTSRRFGDTLLGVPLASMFKYKFKGAEITYGCNPMDVEFYKNINVIDKVVVQSIFNEATKCYDPSYNVVLRGSFDADDKFNPSQIFGKQDDYLGWDASMKHFPVKFNRKDMTFGQGKKKVGIFVNEPRPDMTMPEGTGYYPRWQQVVDLLKDYDVYVFTGPTEQIKTLNNCTFYGAMGAYESVSLMSYMDVNIGVTSGIMDMAGCFAQKPLIILDSCDDNGIPFWHGIPSKCVLPQNRFSYFVMENEDCRSFIKPPKGSLVSQWQTTEYFNDNQFTIKNMRQLSGIQPETILVEVDRMLEKGYGVEWFIEGNVCDNCSVKKDNKCAYKYRPRIKSGGYFDGRYQECKQ